MLVTSLSSEQTQLFFFGLLLFFGQKVADRESKKDQTLHFVRIHSSQ